MKQNQNNRVHIYGFINDIKVADTKSGAKAFFLDVATRESWPKDKEDKSKGYDSKSTFHKVSLVTDDKKAIKQLEKIAKDIENNNANRETEGFKPKNHTASIDGTLVTRENTDDKGVKYYNPLILTSVEGMVLDTKLGEKESRNSAEFKGNIADIDMKDGFAIVSIATHYFAPGEAENYKGETKPYHEETSYIRTRVSEKFPEKTFNALKNGELEVGDLISAKGQMHNNNYQDKEGVNRRNIIIDLRSVKLVAKKGQKEEAAKEEKAEKKAAPAPKKATPKKKQVSM